MDKQLLSALLTAGIALAGVLLTAGIAAGVQVGLTYWKALIEERDRRIKELEKDVRRMEHEADDRQEWQARVVAALRWHIRQRMENPETWLADDPVHAHIDLLKEEV